MEINDKGYIYIYFNGSSMFNRCVYFCDFFMTALIPVSNYSLILLKAFVVIF